MGEGAQGIGIGGVSDRRRRGGWWRVALAHRWVSLGIGAAALALGGLAIAHAHRSANQVHLSAPGVAPFGASLPSTKAGQTWTFGTIPICLDRPGRAQVDSVTVVNARGGLRVTDFSTRPLSPTMLGAEPRRLAVLDFRGTRTVTMACASDPPGAELAVEFHKDQAVTARGDGLLVSWHSHDASGEFSIPFYVVLCQGPDENVEECRSFPERTSQQQR